MKDINHKFNYFKIKINLKSDLNLFKIFSLGLTAFMFEEYVGYIADSRLKRIGLGSCYFKTRPLHSLGNLTTFPSLFFKKKGGGNSDHFFGSTFSRSTPEQSFFVILV